MDLALSKAGSPCLGLIGGLGVGATVHYYRALAKAHEQRQLPLRLLMVHADMPKVLGHAQANQLGELTEYFVSLIGQLKDGGADFAAVSAVTPHLCIGELAAKSPLPLVDLLQVARESIFGKRVALFGTRFVIETDLFGRLAGENTIQPQPGEVNQIHEAYTRTAARGGGAQKDREALTTLAKASNTEFPFIDCAQLHIDAIVKKLLA
jgi:aspartate racemase